MQQQNQNPAKQPGQQQAGQPQKQGGGEADPRQKTQQGNDQSKVGQDTDGDGKVVQPGQKPGQSHGEGLPNKR